MRLIDADKINFEEVFGGQSDFAKDLRKAAQELIGSQPTAFDMEKVIEELKGEIELCVTHPLYPGRYIKKDRAVESAGRLMDEQKRNRNPGRQMVPGRTAA